MSESDAKTNDKPTNALCATLISSYVIQSGDTPKKIIKAAYPDSKVTWGKLWNLIKSCNAKANADGKPSHLKLIVGTSLSIPGIPARLTNAYEKPNNKPDDKDDPVLQKLCGCTPEITVSVISSWLDVVTANYPDVKPAEFAANILTMCNRGAKFVDGSDKKLLAKDQKLRGICSTLEGKSFEQFLSDAHQGREKLKAEMAAKESAGQPEETLSAAFDVTTAQAGTCAINTALSTAAVRDVTLTNSCPVYTNG
jgi:hypothetical protein